MRLRAQIDQELNQRLSQTLCLMFADVVGSTVFYQKHGDVEGRLFVQRHHDTLTPLILQWHGRVIKTSGDAIMAAFEKPEDAFDCTITIQHTLWKARRQVPPACLASRGGHEIEILPRLRKLIEDDRGVYLKVLLDPAFAPLCQHLHPLLSTLCQEMRTEALQRRRGIAEQV